MDPKQEIFSKASFARRRIFSVLLAIFMVSSIFLIITTTAAPASAASGSISMDPVTFAHSSTATIALVNGGTFGSGSTVKFYASSTTTFTSSNTVVATYVLTSGTTSLSNANVSFDPNLLTSGSYYIAASDDSGSSFTGSVAITVTSQNPSISVSKSTVTPGSTETVTGSGFDSGSTLALYLNYPSGTTLVSSFAVSELNTGVSFTVPNDLPGSASGTKYYVVAQETSASSVNYGITADTSFLLTPSVTVSPLSINGASSSTFSVSGYGFPAGKSFSASTSSTPVGTIQFAGVDAINPAFVSDNAGSFTVTVSGLSSAISLSAYNGVQEITVHDSASTAYSNVGTVIVSQSDPALTGFSFAVTATTGSTYNVNDAAVATVWDFPASQTVTFWMGNTEVGTLTTDSNGAGQLATVVPALPGGTYTPLATSSASSLTTSPTSGTSSYTIAAYFTVNDPTGYNMLALTSNTGEYLPATALVTIHAYGLVPSTTTYDFQDSIVAPSGIGAAGLVSSVIAGSESSSSGEFTPANNGTVIFTYSPGYSSESTGTEASITSSNSVSGYDSSSYAYYTIGGATVNTPSSFSIIKSGLTGQGLSVSGLVPYTAVLYPGVTNEYNLYIGNTEQTLSFKNHNSVTTSGTVFDTGDSSISYDAPSLSGVYDLNITYNGGSVGTLSVGTQQIVISSAGASPSDGTIQVVNLSTAGHFEVVGYGFEATPSLYFTTSGSTITNVGSRTLTYGAFVYALTPAAEPAGTYSVFTLITSSGTNYFLYTSYTISASLSLSATSDTVGTSITATASGVVPTTYYGLYFGTSLLSTNTGSSLKSGVSFTVPTVPAGTYAVSVEPQGTTTVTAKHSFTVKANSDITLGTSSQYAFPTELVSFSVKGLTAGTAPSPGTGGTASIVQTYAIVYLNGSFFEQVPASYSSSTLTGYLQTPNDNSGSYYSLSFGAVDQYSVKTETSSGLYVYSTDYVSYSGSSGSDYLGLVSGNGAFLTGITSSQIATLETDINATLSVPISQLDASVTNIQNDVAQISTDFGTMSATLSSINATVASISQGVVYLETSLGQVKTSLASLNATVVALNGDTATISTAVGVFNTTINNINATVTINKGDIATIQTDLGTFTGNVTSVSNGIANIQTKLGTIQTNTNQVVPSYGTSFLLEVVILVLAALAVAFSAVAMARSGRSYSKKV